MRALLGCTFAATHCGQSVCWSTCVSRSRKIFVARYYVSMRCLKYSRAKILKECVLLVQRQKMNGGLFCGQREDFSLAGRGTLSVSASSCVYYAVCYHAIKKGGTAFYSWVVVDSEPRHPPDVHLPEIVPRGSLIHQTPCLSSRCQRKARCRPHTDYFTLQPPLYPIQGALRECLRDILLLLRLLLLLLPLIPLQKRVMHECL